MFRPLRSLSIAAALVCAAGAAFAGASQTPIDYVPDPALRTASKAELQRRVGEACRITQARRQNQPEATFTRACDCYAGRTLASLDTAELDHYRQNGYFNDTARAKAVSGLEACKLQSPF